MNSGGAEGEEKLHSRRKDAFGLTTEAATNTTTERCIKTQRFRVYIKKWVIVGLYSLGLSSIKPDKAERREKSCKTQRIVSALRIWLLSLLNESGFVSGSGS